MATLTALEAKITYFGIKGVLASRYSLSLDRGSAHIIIKQKVDVDTFSN